jgi:hypothetical protein
MPTIVMSKILVGKPSAIPYSDFVLCGEDASNNRMKGTCAAGSGRFKSPTL